jgi:hypothetical protein
LFRYARTNIFTVDATNLYIPTHASLEKVVTCYRGRCRHQIAEEEFISKLFW